MSDLSDLLVRLRDFEDALRDLSHRDDVKSGPLQTQIEDLGRRFAPIVRELEDYRHAELMQQHAAPGDYR